MNEALLNIVKEELVKLHSDLPYVAPENTYLKMKMEDIINLLK
jgi:hypothetical protein